MAKITTLSTGNVVVETSFFDGEQMDTLTREFTQHGAYVYQVNPNGTLSQTCEGLLPTGNTLHGGDNLAEILRKTMA